MEAWSTVIRGWAYLALKRGRLSAAVPGMADQWERARARAQTDAGVRRQQRDDWPFSGSGGSAKLPQRCVLPNAISYPWTPDGPADLRAGQKRKSDVFKYLPTA